MLIYILLYLWLLPLNLLGVLYRDYLTYNNKCLVINITKNYEVYMKMSSGSVSLGKYIFVSPRFTTDIIKHEVGHTKQSKYLGPFYLIIIGIPSFLWASIRNTFPCVRKKYKSDSLFTERWANNLMK